MAYRTVTLWPADLSALSSAVACRAVQAFNGEPSGVQMLAYLAADLAGRTRRMMP
jgi:hypothetical protein